MLKTARKTQSRGAGAMVVGSTAVGPYAKGERLDLSECNLDKWEFVAKEILGEAGPDDQTSPGDGGGQDRRRLGW